MNDGRGWPGWKNRLAPCLPLLGLLLAAAPAATLRAQEDPPSAPAEGAEAAQACEESPEQPSPPAANPGPGTKVLYALRDEVKRYTSDSVALVKAPLSWKKNDWEKAGGVVVILGGLMLVDRDIDKAAQRNRSSFTDRLSSLTTALGDQYGFEVSGAMLTAGLVFHHENLRDTGREALEAGILAHILDQYFFKRAFGRERPADSGGRSVFVPGSNHDSFPSGRFLVRRHGDEKSGVLSKADLQIVPIRHGLAARITM